MINRNTIGLIISGFVYLLVQVLLLKNIVLFDKAFCFIYIILLLFIPLEAGALLLMGVGFVVGIFVDLFYDTVGMHASACVLIMFLRPYWTGMITPPGGYDSSTLPMVRTMGLEWFSIYALPLIFLHHLVLLFIEVGGFSMFWYTIVKVILSTILTFFVVILVQYLFYKRKRSI